MDGLGSNTARSCGIPSAGRMTPSSAPEICRETIVLCWQESPTGFFTISITRRLRSITSDCLTLHPNMRDNFVICRYYATCLQEIARTQEGLDITSAALKSCRLAAKRAQGEGLELIKREEALLLSQAGRLDESFSALQSIRDVGAPTPRYDRAEYLPRTPERLQRLAEIVDSRDVFVLLQGPSF